MKPTKLAYLDDFSDTQGSATVVTVREEDDKVVVVLDQTLFYPQGGGQPYDQGIIKKGSDNRFAVREVRFVDGIVNHIGEPQGGGLTAGDTVEYQIDAERRQLNSRLHSAGHVVDMAAERLGLDWIPGKGYHYPDHPYLEYHGTLDPDAKEELRTKLEQACNDIIKEDLPVSCRVVSRDELERLCRHVPENLPAGKPIRVVAFKDFGVPCGGTHVRALGEIKSMTIPRLKKKDGAIRVSYDVERENSRD